MSLELTRAEAELLIAILQFAEGAAPILQPELVNAIKDLRQFRTALLQVYLRSAGAES